MNNKTTYLGTQTNHYQYCILNKGVTYLINKEKNVPTTKTRVKGLSVLKAGNQF